MAARMRPLEEPPLEGSAGAVIAAPEDDGETDGASAAVADSDGVAASLGDSLGLVDPDTRLEGPAVEPGWLVAPGWLVGPDEGGWTVT